MTKILIVEDEAYLANEIREWLQRELYIVEMVHDGASANESLSYNKYDIVVLDWMLPGVSGLDVCRQFRAAGGYTPVLMLTARSSLDCKETGLDSGADDYLTKPFHMKELSARIRSLLRRQTVSPGSKLEISDIVLDPKARTITKAGELIHLEPREFNLLEFLIRHPNVTFSSDALIQRVWESDKEVSHETLRSYIKSIRKKLDKAGEPSIIDTVHGSGYKVSNSK